MTSTIPRFRTSDGALRHLAAAGGCDCHAPGPMMCEWTMPAGSCVLRLSPTVVAKLLYFRQVRGREAVAAGVSLPDEPLVIVDARLRSPPSTLADRLRKGESDAASEEHVWILTHAGDDPTPTPSDEDVFGILRRSSAWAVLCVLTPGGRNTARLEFHIGPGGHLRLPVCVDLSRPFAAADHAAWDRECAALPEAARSKPVQKRLTARRSQSADRRSGRRAEGCVAESDL